MMSRLRLPSLEVRVVQQRQALYFVQHQVQAVVLRQILAAWEILIGY